MEFTELVGGWNARKCEVQTLSKTSTKMMLKIQKIVTIPSLNDPEQWTVDSCSAQLPGDET
jgi:hypothetical protein